MPWKRSSLLFEIQTKWSADLPHKLSEKLGDARAIVPLTRALDNTTDREAHQFHPAHTYDPRQIGCPST